MKENQHIEWKESLRDGCLTWVRGFANAEGGRLVRIGNAKTEHWEITEGSP